MAPLLDIYLENPFYLWMTLAAILFLAELIVPGVFLIWLALAAAITGLATLLLPMHIAIQLLIFGAASVAAVMLGRRWYVTSDHSDNPKLNDRGAQMVGRTVTVVKPVTPIGGRVKVGDGEWPARGPELAIGDTARIVAVEGGTVILETTESEAEEAEPATL